jgi:hypothetical protein
VLEFHAEHKTLIEAALGSRSNHQAWDGGYVDHLSQCFVLLEKYHRTLTPVWSEHVDKMSAYIVLYFHDIDKIWKYSKDGLPLGFNLIKFYTETLKDQWGIMFDEDELNALKYIHGEGGDYSKTHRVMRPLAALCHIIDVTSARLLFDKGPISITHFGL